MSQQSTKQLPNIIGRYLQQPPNIDEDDQDFSRSDDQDSAILQSNTLPNSRHLLALGDANHYQYTGSPNRQTRGQQTKTSFPIMDTTKGSDNASGVADTAPKTCEDRPTATASDAKVDPSVARAKACLIGANFFVETNRFEPLLAVYLIEFHGWDVAWVGYVSVVMNLLMLVMSTPSGDLMDKTDHKRLVTAGAIVTASVTTAAVAWKTDLWFIILIKAVEGLAATLFLPALMSLLLGVVPTDDVPKVVSLTEMSNKIGSVLFTAGCGLLSYYSYPNVDYIFYLLMAGGLTAACFIVAIPGRTIDHDRARALNQKEETAIERLAAQLGDGDDAGSGAGRVSVVALAASALETVRRSSQEFFLKEPPSRYKELLRDRNVAVFAALTFLYHLFNAGVLPLLAQLLAHEDQRSGLAFAAGSMCVAFFAQAPVAYAVGRQSERFGYKNLLLLGFAVLPLRCLNLALFTMFWPNQYALVATQVWDGISAGIYDTLLPLVVKALVQGSGRFGFTFGFIITCWRLGHGFSLLMVEEILKAAEYRYEIPFFVCMAGGAAVFLLTAIVVVIPDPQQGEGEANSEAEGENAEKEAEIVVRTSVMRRMSGL